MCVCVCVCVCEREREREREREIVYCLSDIPFFMKTKQTDSFVSSAKEAFNWLIILCLFENVKH